MADTSYQPKIYHKQGGDHLVVANGGEIELESGSKVDIQSGGEIEGLSGGIFDAQEGFSFFLDGEAVLAEKLKNYALSGMTLTNYVSLVSIQAVSVMTPAYGIVFFSYAAGCSKVSADLPLPSIGAYLILHFSGMVSNAAMSLRTQSAGAVASVSCQSLFGSNISTIYVAASTAGHPGRMVLRCFTDNCWTITEHDGDASAQAAA